MIARCITLLLTVGAIAPAGHAQSTAELWESEQMRERLETNELIERALAMGKIQDLSERPYRSVRLVEVPIVGECVDITHRSCGSRYLLVLSTSRNFSFPVEIWDLGYLGKVFGTKWRRGDDWWTGELVLDAQNWNDWVIDGAGTRLDLVPISRKTKTFRYRVAQDGVELMR